MSKRGAVSRPVIGTIEDIESVLHGRVVDEVAICLSPTDWSYVEPVTRICEEEGKIVRVSIQSLGGLLTGGHFEEVGGLPIVTFLYGPDRFLGMLAKRAFDIVGSVAAAGAAQPGPAGRRCSTCASPTDRRSCSANIGSDSTADRSSASSSGRWSPTRRRCCPRSPICPRSSGPAFKIADDPRITRVGRFLRRTSLDELPQLWNVLRGEMSIVGPRPAPPREVEQYSIWHRRRLSMRPGLTGLWQVSARSEADFDRRVELDLDYIDRWSLWMDIKILLRTIPVIVAQEGR